MGDIVPLPKRKRAPKPTTPPRPAAALSIDAVTMLRSYEMARRGVAALATSPLWRNVHRSVPFYRAASKRARADFVRSMQMLGMIR